jgi:hypothetical protein
VVLNHLSTVRVWPRVQQKKTFGPETSYPFPLDLTPGADRPPSPARHAASSSAQPLRPIPITRRRRTLPTKRRRHPSPPGAAAAPFPTRRGRRPFPRRCRHRPFPTRRRRRRPLPTTRRIPFLQETGSLCSLSLTVHPWAKVWWTNTIAPTAADIVNELSRRLRDGSSSLALHQPSIFDFRQPNGNIRVAAITSSANAW